MRSGISVATVVAATVLVGWAAQGAAQEPNLAQRLGYPRDARLVIVHADDIGVTHSVNAASERALATGLVNSGSVMVPCAWTPEIVAWVKAHPDADLGLHLTMVSERPGYRWGPVAPRAQVHTLLDSDGYLRARWDTATHPDPVEVEREARAQIERAYALGLHPTHLDSHEYRMQMHSPQTLAALVKLGHEYHLPVLIVRDWFAKRPWMAAALAPGDVVIDHMVTLGSRTPPRDWAARYTHAIETLQPGVTEFIIHPGYDDDELQAFAPDSIPWGAAWRQRDLDFFTSARFRALLAQNHVQLITWREITMRLAQRARALPRTNRLAPGHVS